MAISNMFLEKENGETQTSLINLYRNVTAHGDVVGAIHRVDPRGNHSTLLFHADGFIHTSTGFRCGALTQETKTHIMGLIIALSRIPLMGAYIVGTEYIFNIGTDEDLRKYVEEDDFVMVNYVFRPPAQLVPKFILDSRGSKALDNLVLNLAQDTLNYPVEANW